MSHGRKDEKRRMIDGVILAALLVIGSPLAVEAQVQETAALAVAALVGQYSPTVSAGDQKVLAALLDGNIGTAASASTISVKADSIVCRVSNVDITSRSCTLTFGQQMVVIEGRKANELLVTLTAAGVSSQGAAGTIYTGLTNLACSVDIGQLRQKAGLGANCTFAGS
jgi:hypothetical protein